MPLEIVTVPCRADNYAYAIHDPASGQTAVVDVPDAAPILAVLANRGWQLSDIWITHHHGDHTDGVAALKAATGARVVGNADDAHRLPPLDLGLTPGMTLTIGAAPVHVMDVSGHTVGHIAFHIPSALAAFTADSLMACGCGRMFEGTAPMFWASLSRLAALPSDTQVFSGHEYTTANIRFALSLEPDNPALISRASEVEALRREGRPTVPSSLAQELATNPFLRANLASIKAAIGLPGATDAEAFAAIRARKDKF
jgi:hydroxyacylglutathione hydrolase